MIFRQLFEPVSSTYTYLIACEEGGQAILVDPVLPAWQRDLEVLKDLGLRLAITLDTHIHADHITAASRLRRETGSTIAHPAIDALSCVDRPVREGEPLVLGSIRLDPLSTPGHTDGHHAYLLGDRVLTGDALLIDGCGRTDFQGGDAATLYRSIHDNLFTLPGETLVYPAHDYEGRCVSSIAKEKQRNPRLGDGKPLQVFMDIMGSMDLPYPKFIDFALPGNRACGVCPEDIPEHLQEYCQQISNSRQG
jgi:glyoxylase-like metal-dependent hydrolase (beta-lactamase superfamily II)